MSNRVLFLRESYSDRKFKKKKNRKKTLKVQFFSHGKSNSCGVLITYFGTGTFTVKKQQTDKEVRILILDVSINDSEYILITKH